MFLNFWPTLKYRNMTKQARHRLLELTALGAVFFSAGLAHAESLKVASQSSGKIKASFDVEVARDEHERGRGLMYRKSLGLNAGMLFLFPEPTTPAFWMKNTLIPLDMVFIDEKGLILGIHNRAKPHNLTPISPSGPVKAVLEINGGQAEKLGLRVGDPIISSSLTN